MTAQTSDHEYLLDENTIVDKCFIPLEGDSTEKIQRNYLQTCKEYFKKKMILSDYLDYPDYFKKPCQHLYSAPQEGEDEGVFDLDGAFEVLDQMLDAHIQSDSRGISIIGSALQYSYKFFERILEIAVTSHLFSVKQFVVESNEYEGYEDWTTIYECQDGKMVSVYCSG